VNRHYPSRVSAALAGTQRVGRSVAGILQTRYPRFLLGLPLARGEIPVFIYHDVDAAGFANDLQFLQINGYRTLSLEEFLASHDSKGGGHGRRILLTFDDARSSFYDIALPTLHAFGARATLFAPSYWMRPPEPKDDNLFMNWDQLRACAESGLVDVQSHAHRHALVFTSERLVGFASPSLLARYDIYDWPMRHTAAGDRLGRPAPGSPVYRAAPLLSARGRYLESAGLTDACVQLVARSGGADFFARPDWEARLRRLYASRAGVLRGEHMKDDEFRALVASDLELAHAEFRAHMGYAPTSLAYPWMLGSRLSLEVARRCGFHNAFGVALDYRRARDRRLPVPAFGRLKADWLPLLPGQGRASFISIAARKIGAFAKIQHLAH
jgi:peptidoglycan/xylan/chitin deacetylase (PgdA/CDA1 family)